MDFVTLDEYKVAQDIKSTNQDDLINGLIPRVSSFIKTYCNRNLIDNYTTDKVEYWSAGGQFVYLKEPPVVTLTSVEVSYDYGLNYTALAVGTQYVLDKEQDAVFSPTGDFPSGPNAVKVTYKGGYNPDSPPDDLKQAAIELTTYFLKNESTPRRSTTSTNLAIEYITSSNLPAHIKRLLDNYRYMNT